MDKLHPDEKRLFQDVGALCTAYYGADPSDECIRQLLSALCDVAAAFVVMKDNDPTLAVDFVRQFKGRIKDARIKTEKDTSR